MNTLAAPIFETSSSFVAHRSAFVSVGFITPWLAVAGILLASIPVIIHLLNRRRFRIVEWAAMDFLLAALRKNRRRIQFEQWLLLATRCAVLLLLGLALARPVGCDEGAIAAGATRSGLHVLLIDNSYSMAYEANRPEARTHLDQAKKIARQIVSQLSSGGEAVAIVTAGSPAKVALQPTYDLAAAASAIDRVEQTAAGTDIRGALKLAMEIGEQNARLPFRRLEMFTDATRSAWEPGHRDEIAAMGPPLAKLFSIRHFNLSQPDQWNAAIIGLAPSTRLVRSGFDNDLVAVGRSFGRASESAVRWSLDNATATGGAAVALSTDTPPIVQSSARFSEGGAHSVVASIAAGDRLPVDDARYCVVEVASSLRVLIVEGERGVGPLAGSGAFLELALAPPAEVGTPGASRRTSSYVAPDLISDLELNNRVLSDYRAVILAGVGQVSASQADQLKRFVEDGGTLIVFMGEAVAGENYNQTLLPRGLLPGPLSKRVGVAADQRGFAFDFNPHGSLHPLLRIFAGEEKSGLDTAQVFTYWQVDLPADGKAQRVLDFTARDGRKDPAITLHEVGGGRVLTVATTANADWTSFPAKPAYVALVHEMLAGSVGGGDGWMNLQVGDAVELPPGLPLKSVPVLKDSSQQEIPMQPTTRPDGRPAYRSVPLTKPGMYTLLTGAATLPIAVNVPADEADIRPTDDRAIRAALGGIEIDTEGAEPPSIASVTHGGNDFGWIVMVVVLALVGAESWMAMRFGHYRK